MALKYFFDQGEKRTHNKIFPNNFRMLIVGPSGCGKTTLLMRLLLEDGLLNYDNIYVFARNLNMPEYQVLKEGFENGLRKKDIRILLNSGKSQRKNNVSLKEYAQLIRDQNDELDIEPESVESVFSQNGTDIPDPNELDNNKKNIIIFDDIMTMKDQTTPDNYFTRGRPMGCSCIYLAQHYTNLNLHTIRDNANIIVLFQSNPDLVRSVFDAIKDSKIMKEDFNKMCEEAWNKDYGYLVIDKSRKPNDKSKFRENIYLHSCSTDNNKCEAC